MVDISDKIDKYIEREVPLDAIIQHYLDFMVHIGYLLFPIFLFLSVIWFTSKLANNTEVIAMLSSGISYARFLRPFLMAATIISVFSLVMGMYVVPEASKGYNEFRFQYMKRGKDKERQTSNLFTQLNKNDYIYVSSYNPKRKIGYNFTYEHFDENELVYKISARNIRWNDKDSTFVMNEYKKRIIGEGNDIIQTFRRKDTLFSFDLEDLSPVSYIAETLNYKELNKFIEKERKRGASNLSNHLLVKYKRLSLPISVFILTIIAVAVSSMKRRGGMGVNLAFGILIAFTFIFFDKIFGVMAEQSGFSPLLASWLPNIIFGVMAVFLLNHAKR